MKLKGILVFQMQGKTGECINEETGVVFQVDQTLMEVLNYIKDKNIKIYFG